MTSAHPDASSRNGAWTINAVSAMTPIGTAAVMLVTLVGVVQRGPGRGDPVVGGGGGQAEERDVKARGHDLRDIDLAAAAGADQEPRLERLASAATRSTSTLGRLVGDDHADLEPVALQDLLGPVSRELGGLRAGDDRAPRTGIRTDGR